MLLYVSFAQSVGLTHTILSYKKDYVSVDRKIIN